MLFHFITRYFYRKCVLRGLTLHSVHPGHVEGFYENRTRATHQILREGIRWTNNRWMCNLFEEISEEEIIEVRQSYDLQVNIFSGG